MQLAFAAAGATIGGMAFGPEGASWGWSLGSALGGMLAGKDDTTLPDQFGPRLGDLKIQTSTYGNVIPRAWGTVRIAGNMIWASDWVEHATTQSVTQGGGGKGMGGGGGGTTQSQTTYSYTGDFAIAICEGPIVGIRKVWVGGNLLHDVGSDSDTFSVLASTQNMTVYLGTETQTADPTMEAADPGQTPAYRGTAYVVFHDLPREDYGNFEFEVVVNGTNSVLIPHDLYTLPGSDKWTNSYGNIPQEFQNAARAASAWIAKDVGGQPLAIALYDNYSHVLLTSVTSANHLSLMGVGWNGRAWYQEYVAGSGLKNISTTGQVMSFYNPGFVEFDGVNRMQKVYEFAQPGLDQETAPVLFIEYNPTATFQFHIYRVTPGAIASTYAAVVTGRNLNYLADSADRIPGRLYINSFYTGNGQLGWVDTTGTYGYTVVRAYTAVGQPYAMCGSDGYLYCRSVDAGQADRVEKMTPDGAVVDYCALPGISATDYSSVTRMVMDSTGNLYVQVERAIFRIKHGTMELDASATLANSQDWIVPSDTFEGRGVVVIRSESGGPNNVVRLIDLDRITPAPPALSTVVADLCTLAGLSSGSDIDVAALTGLTVSGYVVSSRGSVRSAIEPLMGTYFFDGVESDNKVKFVVRAGSQAVVIPEDDLAAHTGEPSQMPDPLLVTRKQEMELPVEANILYLNKVTDYQVSQQRSRRLVTSAKQTYSLNVPIVFTDNEAQRIADTRMYAAWVERESYAFQTSRKYMKYEPTDVLGVTKNGVVHNLRVTQKDEGSDGVIKWMALADYGSIYSQSSVGAPSAVAPAVAELEGPTVLEFMDVPLLRDSDDDAGFYIAARGAASGWRGMQLYQSRDGGATYEAVTNGVILTPSTMGRALTALGTIAANQTELVDEGNYVDVFMTSGSLASITTAQLLDRGNAAMLGDEIIQFRTATLTAANTYRLSGLLRGRLGSESFVGTHAVGEAFVLLDNNIRSIPAAMSDRDKPYIYKAVSVGQTLAQTAPLGFTNHARRMKPLAPVQIGGGANGAGDWVLQWVRRTRFDATWTDSADAPLGETSESYLINIIKDGSLVVRSLTSATPTVTYTAAQQIADFGSVRGALTVDVYQVGSAYGKGYATRKVFTAAVPAYYWAIGNLTIPGGLYLQTPEVAIVNDQGTSIVTGASGVNENMTFTVPGMAGTGSATVVSPAGSILGHLSAMFDGVFTVQNTYWNEVHAEDPGWYLKFDFSASGKIAVASFKQSRPYPYDDVSFLNRYIQAFSVYRSDTGTGTPYTNPSEWILVATKTGITQPTGGFEEYQW